MRHTMDNNNATKFLFDVRLRIGLEQRLELA